MLAAASGVRARDHQRASELLTPRGWENSDAELLADDELLIPASWRAAIAQTSDLGWAGIVCSELLVPADWKPALPKR